MHLRRYTVLCSLGRRRRCDSLLLLLLVSSLAVLLLSRLLPGVFSMTRLLIKPSHDPLQHLRNNRNLHNYVDELAGPLIEPSSMPCQDLEQVPVVAVVASAPGHARQRQAIRDSWAKELPTYFVIGMGPSVDEQLVENYMEAKQHSDLVVFDFADVYSNLTLKVALMMRWTLRRCPQAEFVLKTDDDVLVNPWTLQQVIKEHVNDKLVGFKLRNTSPHRSTYSKYYLPKWLYPNDTIPEYLSGTGYLINGEYLQKIYKTAFKLPLVHLEDVFFTFLVAKKSLGLKLAHDPRMTPNQALVPLHCAYWDRAIVHSLDPNRITAVWKKIKAISNEYNDGQNVCETYRGFSEMYSSISNWIYHALGYQGTL